MMYDILTNENVAGLVEAQPTGAINDMDNS